MLAQFLPFKYSNLKFANDINQKALKQLGWKARKYIRWAEVHVGNDRELLKEFGDKAIDEQKLVHSLFPRVNEILLNVQRWRLDKKDFAVEPSHTASWDRARALIEGANENPGIISSYLSDHGVDLSDLSNEEIYTCFENCVVSQLIISIRRPNLKIDYSDLAFKDPSELLVYLQCLLPEAVELSEVGSQSLTFALGLPQPEISYQEIPRFTNKQSVTVVCFEKLPMEDLFRASADSDTKSIVVNENNSFVAEMTSSEEKEAILKRFIKVFYEVREKQSVNSKQINDFLKVLALSLDNEFEDFSEVDLE